MLGWVILGLLFMVAVVVSGFAGLSWTFAMLGEVMAAFCAGGLACTLCMRCVAAIRRHFNGVKVVLSPASIPAN